MDRHQHNLGKREQEGPMELRRDPLGRIPWLRWEMACGKGVIFSELARKMLL